MSKPSIGDQELLLLHYLDQRKDATVGEVTLGFGEERGLARTTILTMMERLRGKGYLHRHRASGVYRYKTTAALGETLHGAVDRFVRNTLRGSISPLVAWMAERGAVSDKELSELKALVAQLRTERKEK